MDPVGTLLGIPLFRDLDAAAVAELGPHLHQRRFARGESLWLEGEPAEALHLLVEGLVKSYRVSYEGSEVILGLNRAVDLVGEIGVFHPSGRRQLSVAALEPSRCLLLAREPLLAFLARHPAALRRMLQRLSSGAVDAAYLFSGVAFDDLRRRVATALLALATDFGEPVPDGAVRVQPRLSQATLAAMVAASRENVNRALAGFVADGAVSQRDGRFHVHDRRYLERVAAGTQSTSSL